jgi:hypothetical protein
MGDLAICGDGCGPVCGRTAIWPAQAGQIVNASARTAKCHRVVNCEPVHGLQATAWRFSQTTTSRREKYTRRLIRRPAGKPSAWRHRQNVTTEIPNSRLRRAAITRSSLSSGGLVDCLRPLTFLASMTIDPRFLLDGHEIARTSTLRNYWEIEKSWDLLPPHYLA